VFFAWYKNPFRLVFVPGGIANDGLQVNISQWSAAGGLLFWGGESFFGPLKSVDKEFIRFYNSFEML
jgi:hypothetical protein